MVENVFDCSRRGVLKAGGAVGIPGFGPIKAIEKREGQASELESQTLPFVTLSMAHAADSADQSAEISCGGYPSFGHSGTGERMQSPGEKVYLTNYPHDGVDLTNRKGIIANPNGISSVEGTKLRFPGVPIESDCQGNSTYLARSSPIEFDLTVQNDRASLGSDIASVDCELNSQISKTIGAKTTFGNRYEIEISLAYHGLKKVIGHPKMYLFPRDENTKNIVRGMEAGDSIGPHGEADGAEVTVREYEGTGAYGIDIETQEGGI